MVIPCGMQLVPQTRIKPVPPVVEVPACSVTQWYPTPFDLMDCSSLGSCVHGISQMKTLQLWKQNKEEELLVSTDIWWSPRGRHHSVWAVSNSSFIYKNINVNV